MTRTDQHAAPSARRDAQLGFRVRGDWRDWWHARMDAIQQETGLSRQTVNELALSQLAQSVDAIADAARRVSAGQHANDHVSEHVNENASVFAHEKAGEKASTQK